MTLRILIFSLFFIQQVHAQTDRPSSYLWEISHPDVAHSSYVFGSIRVNNSEIFDFTDSIEIALRNSEIYLTELDFMEMDSSILSSEFEDTNKSDTESSDFDMSSLNFSDYFAIDGKPTYLDAYLAKVALEMGKQLKGAFDYEEYAPLYDTLNAREITLNSNQDELEEYIDAYTNMDLEYFYEEFSVSTIDPFQIAFRNDLFTKEIDDLHKKESLFFVIGIGHLVDSNSILKQLERLGYSVRNVGKGQFSNELEKLYNRFEKSDNWQAANGTTYSYSLKTPKNPVTFLEDDILEMHMSYSSMDGLIYASMVFPDPGNTEPTKLENLVYGLLNTKSIKEENIELNGRNIQRFETISNDTVPAMQFNILKENDHFIFAMLIGLSSEALQSKTIPYFIDNIRVSEKAEAKWSMQKSELGNLQYYFPENISFIRSTTKAENFPEYDDIVVAYKTFKEGDTEYLIQIVKNPTGITYTEPQTAHEEYKNLLHTMLGVSLKEESSEYAHNKNRLSSESVFSDTLGYRYYIKQFTRGSMAFRALEKTNNQERNSIFFDSFDILVPEKIPITNFAYEDAEVEMKVPTSKFQSNVKSENSTLDAFNFSDSISGITMTLEFDEFDKYIQYDLDDISFDYHNILDTTQFDTLYSYEHEKLANQCHSFTAESAKFNSFQKSKEIGFYCNNHYSSITLLYPVEYEETSLLDEISESIHINVNHELCDFSAQDKSNFILSDLSSRDTSVFSVAKEALEDHEGFDSTNVNTMLDLLSRQLLDQDSLGYTVDYYLIAALHEFKSDEVEEAIMKAFDETENFNVKQIVLESMRLRDQSYSQDNFLNLIKNSASDYSLPNDLFSIYTDSLELFEKYYDTIKEIALTTDYDKNALELVIHWLLKDTSTVLKEDDGWIESSVELKIRDYLEQSAIDTLASIDYFIMDYLEENTMEKYEDVIIEEILSADDNFGQYRLLTSPKFRDQIDEQTVLKKVMNNEYYHYWINLYYQENEFDLGEEYSNINVLAQSVMRQFVYDNYDFYCQECEILETFDSSFTLKEDFLLARCKKEEGQFYYGAVGPILNDVTFSFELNDSVYFPNPLTLDQKEEVKQEFREYFISNKEE